MTTDSSPATPFTDCVKVLRPEHRQLLLGLPHFITYLIAGADGEIDHWELVLVLEAIDETEEISPDFEACRETYQAEISPYLDRICKATKEKGASLMFNLKWMLTDLEKYQELMPLLPSDLQENIRRYVYRTGMAIAQASDDGSADMDNARLRIGAVEHTFLALVWDAFEITGDPELPKVSSQGRQVRSAYSPSQNSPKLVSALT
jgi:hypothetical protein